MFLKKILNVVFLIFTFFYTLSAWAEVPFLVPDTRLKEGIGQWYKMPFGQVRLISCSTGVKNLPIVVGGLQVELNDGWILKKPTLKPISDEFPVQIGYPVRLGNGQNVSYKGKVLFPITYARRPTDEKDFLFGVQGNLNVCQKKNCLDLPFQIVLPLFANESEYTTMCAYILANNLQIPLDAKYGQVEGKAYLDEKGVHLQVLGVEEPTFAFLQTENQDSFKVQETQLKKTEVRFLLTDIENWEKGHSKNLIVITNKGIYRVPFVMQSNPFETAPVSPDWEFWLIGFEWFLISPLLIWWGMGTPKNTKLLRNQILKMGIGLCLLYPLVLWGHQQNWGILDGQYLTYFYWVVLGGILIYPLLNWKMTLLLFLVWPRPFLKGIDLNNYTDEIIFLWCIITFLEMIFPLFLLYLRADIYGKILRHEMKKNQFRLALSFLIPTFGLIIWSVYFFNISHFTKDADFVPKGWVIVCDDMNSSCASWHRLSKEQVQIFSSEDVVGESLKKLYDVPQGTLVVLYDELGRFILQPDTTVSKGRSFLTNVKNYHAADKP